MWEDEKYRRRRKKLYYRKAELHTAERSYCRRKKLLQERVAATAEEVIQEEGATAEGSNNCRRE